MANPDPDQRAGKRPDFLPLILLAALACVLLSGLWLFPMFMHYMSNQDCVATGRTNC